VAATRLKSPPSQGLEARAALRWIAQGMSYGRPLSSGSAQSRQQLMGIPLRQSTFRGISGPSISLPGSRVRRREDVSMISQRRRLLIGTVGP
jgi:hypothetical protein